MTSSIIVAQSLTTGYEDKRDKKVVSDRLTLSVDSGDLICLVGPNGVGKSTLLRTLTGLQAPLSGSVSLLGLPLNTYTASERAQHIGIVLTERLQVGMMDVRSLVSLGRYPFTGWLGSLAESDQQIVDQAMEAVGVMPLSRRTVGTLSDGERQKVMIARALAQEPKLVVLDEPTAFLDFPRRMEILHLLRELAHRTDHAVLLSTHDLDLAFATADRLWLMNANGSVSVGAPEDLVLAGAFETVFDDKRIRFDPEREKFVVSNEKTRSVCLIAQGKRRRMAKHALSRIGLLAQTDNDGSLPTMVDTGYSWIIKNGTGDNTHDDLYSALRELRQV